MADIVSDGDQGGQQPDESTALLANRPTLSTTPQSRTQLPAINPFAKQIQRQGLHTLDGATSSLSLSSPAEKAAYKLLISLRLLTMCQTSRSAKLDVYAQWEEEEERHESIRSLETQISLTWKEFVEEGRLGDDIHACLWAAFPLEEGVAPRVRGTCISYVKPIAFNELGFFVSLEAIL